MATFSNGESGSSVRTKLNEIINKVEGVSDINNNLTVDGNFTVTGDFTVQGTTITVDSATAQTIVLGDNDKMTFGDSADLQIYHDGSNSRIQEAGSGNLIIRASAGTYIQGVNGENGVVVLEDGAVTLWNNGASKLATTSTGIDVTGTVTADGLTVDGNSNVTKTTVAGEAIPLVVQNQDSSTSTAVSIGFANTSTADQTSSLTKIGAVRVNTPFAGDTDVFINTQTNGGSLRRALFSTTGDISFYEDTGVTPKFFWDASAETLAIGASSATRVSTAYGQITLNGSSGGLLNFTDDGVEGVRVQSVASDFYIQANGSTIFRNGGFTGSDEAMRITSSGSVGIGTSSPTAELEITAATPEIRLRDNSGTENYAALTNVDGRFVIQSDDGNNIGSSTIEFQVDGSERMRIDASGNLLVGTTSTALHTSTTESGVRAGGAGPIMSAGAGTVGYFNRNGGAGDGTILDFRKDGATVGSIGTYSTALTAGTTDTGLYFNAVVDQIQPWNLTTNSARDAAIDFGSSTRRFKDLYLSGTANVDTVSANAVDLDAIAATIADTAVDIFVYDTRKDSDGGAWRKRTQHTSWYNETLNTATRGSRKEFPAVAVLVLENAKLTIYDGDDPSLPMWMVFDMSGTPSWTTSDMLWSDNDHTSVQALNGMIVTTNISNSGLQTAEFITDQGYIAGTNAGLNGFYGGNIAQRNDGLGVLGGSPRKHYLIINNNGNDVAMTVLPNAPIDAATGLPVPTIAVATDGGVSVIKDDGTVVDTTATTQFTNIAFAGNDMWATDKAFADEIRYYKNVSGLADGFTHDFTYWGGSFTTSSNTGLPQPWWDNSSSLYDEFAVTDYGIAARQHSNGFFALNPDATHKNGLGAYIASSYNTGWMNGDIKLATLSDTDATNVTGSELVTNGTFDTDTSGWTIGSTSTATIVSGKLEITSTSTSDRNVRQSLSVVAGKTYVFQVDSQTSPASGAARVRVGNTNGGYEYVDNIPSGTYTSYSYTFTPTQSTIWVSILPVTDGTTITRVDNISVRLAEEDRSVNGNGLQVFGTVTKSAVATGADLVGYSNFASNRYLRQPYNSDLDYGTGDFHYIWWATSLSSAADRMPWGRGDYSAAGSISCIYANSGGGSGKLFITVNGNTGGGIYSDSSLSDGLWHQYVFLCRGQKLYLYIDGKLQSYATPALTQSATQSGAVLTLGNNTNNGTDWAYAHTGNLALFRTGATAPSPEQIKKIYEDEKVLFQENAKATLHGSSDAVTALAYDDSTNLLHVGTSAGRSVFQGLKRVDNTTTAVGAAISASNGLVADE